MGNQQGGQAPHVFQKKFKHENVPQFNPKKRLKDVNM